MHTVLLLIGATLTFAESDAGLQRFEYSQPHMGTVFAISLYSADETAANKAAAAAFDRIRRLDEMLSDYRSDSELMRLCRSSGPGRPVRVSPELLTLLARASEISRLSDGAFDVSVGPLVQEWRRARRRKSLPDPDRLEQARQRVDYRQIVIDHHAGTVELRLPDMRLDLGGIAKGYAADEALRVLQKHGITRALVNASGDITAGDPPPGRDGWTIGVAPLDGPEAQPGRFLSVANAAVATSGDAFQFVEIDGRRYSHVVDPHTGLGISRLSSATVVARDGMTADALASAVSVLGPRKGGALIGRVADVEALILEWTPAGPQTIESDGFARFQIAD